ncbi:MAG: metallophosphoesterase family protein [Eubacteriales bacterium]
MKVVVFSDVHGNKRALEAMLEKEEPKKEDFYIFCGDFLAYGYLDDGVLNLIKSIPNLVAVRGNHDECYEVMHSNHASHWNQPYGMSDDIRIGEVVEFIQSLPDYLELDLGMKKWFVCHGSRKSYLEGRIYPDSELEETEYDYVIHGHSHFQMERQVGKTLYLNPGSLGQPRDGKGLAYCVLDIPKDGGVSRITFENV